MVREVVTEIQPEHELLRDDDIAIVGMAAHLPGAADVDEYWRNLRDGVSSIRRLSREELLEAGESPGRIADRHYVPFAAPLDGFERFDAEFFGFGPKEAAIMDPQHRQFLEVCWEALENAGRPPERFPGRIGVYAGCGMGSYFYVNLCTNPALVDGVGMFLLRHTGNDKDFLATRVSHIFDLKGPSVSVQTACSTSLVATHYACQALLSGECDMALAGGVTIELPQRRGYLYKEGEILSPDGACHAFDHRAQGTVFGSGAGVVVLRRLADALADGDHVWAVIKGTAVNNDGAAKAGYLAPSVNGQAEAIAEAHAVAGVRADGIGYVECHGTGTYLGDPIEVAALTQAFRRTTDRAGFCRIGSVKTNIGHLDTAAGVASLIKAALALHHRRMPPSLGFEEPNPAIDFASSPFVVNATLTDWPEGPTPRRAGVNSLGVGGTNAHAVLEEAPPRPPAPPSDWPHQILTLSARSRAALDDASRRLAAHLRAHPEQPLADVAWTLKEGRRAFDKRRVLVAATHEEAAALLEAGEPRRVFTHSAVGENPEVVFMFPGGGAQYVGMARGLYETEPVFRDWVDRGLAILQPRLDYDIAALWLAEGEAAATAAERLKRPSVQLPLIMIVEHALARLWMSWGVTPAALVGHSMGENAAACLAGVMSFEDCVGLVHLRGRLFDAVPAGGMLSVPLAAEALAPLLERHGLDMASVNAPALCVASGPQAGLDALRAELAAQGVECQRVAIDIAAHSRMLEPILEPFGAYLRSIRLSPPRIPVVSNRTGRPLTDAEATDPDYWVGHLRGTVRFADCMATLAETPGRVFLEVGPGKALSSLAQACGAASADQALSSLRHPEERVADDVHFLGVIGRLWAVGVEADWSQIWGEGGRRRTPLPGYPFQRSPYFIAPGAARTEAAAERPARLEDVAAWGWRPVWRPRPADCEIDVATGLGAAAAHTWLVFVDDAGLGARVAARLRGEGARVIEVHAGDAFARLGEDRFQLSPERGREGYDQLLRALIAQGAAPDRVAHFWLVTQGERFRPGSSFFHRNLERGFHSLTFLAQAAAEENLPRPLRLTVVASGAAQVRDEALPYPEKATALGPVRVIPRELPGVSCSFLDVALPRPSERLFGGRPAAALLDPFAGRRAVGAALDALVERVLEELMAAPGDPVAALRGDKRFALTFRPTPLPAPAEDALPVREGAVCLITGGFGGVGLTVAETLIRRRGAKIALVARTVPPPREAWPRLLRARGPFDPVVRRIRAIERLEAAGGAVTAVAADVSDVEAMAAAVAAVRARFGRIDVVIHAAGAVADGPLLTKTTAVVEAVFTPKIHGLQVLDALFPDGALELMVLFSSTSTIAAPAGQVDYVAANEYLNAYARSRRGGRTRTVALNWGVWSEVGMAAEAVAERMGERPAPPREPVAAPMLDEATFDAQGARLFLARYAAAERWVLDEHRTAAGEALIPGSAYLELAAEALRANGEEGPFEIRDLFFLRPLQVDDGQDRAARVRLTRAEAGYRFEAQSAVTVEGRPAFQTNAEATLALGALPEPPRLDLAAIRARCPRVETATGPEGLRSPQEAHLRFGPRWRVLRETAYGEGEGLARLALPAAARGDLAAGWLLHPALMDLATGWAMGLIAGYRAGRLWAPVSYATARVFAPLPAEVVSWVRAAGDNRDDAPFARFDVTICDPEGRVLVAVEGFSIRRIEGAFARGRRPGAGEVEFEDAAPGRRQPLSAAEERLAHNMAQGIRPEEGGEAFLRALALPEPQIVASSLDLDALVAQAAAGAASEDRGGQSFDRPALDAAYVAPRTDVERTLAGFWEELLGVRRIGVEDSFFDLGGHSLIAVRLFAMVRKAYRVDFPISVLFEAPTIAKCAALIAAQIGADAAAEGGGGAPAAARPPARRFTHLVAMHDGEGGPRTPFFLVAGMFGNVLNLRHLAHLIGADRRFYGLQARGLYGDDRPHTSLVEAARDYLAELRVVQPQGPYMLGGFSGGGVTAYEMARQLRAAGETVAVLAMLDTPLPVRPALGWRDRALIKLAQLRAGGVGYVGAWARARIAWEFGRLRARFEEAPPVEPGARFHDAAIEAAFREAVASYPLAPWDGPLTLFRPPLARRYAVSNGRWVDGQREYVSEDNGWTPWAPAVQVVEVPGDHDSMVLEPNVRTLAARLRAVIEAAEAQARRGAPWPLASAAE